MPRTHANRKNPRLPSLAAAALGLLVCVGVTAQTITSKLPSLKIRAFAEDGDGRVWIGTNHGLSHYTGSSYFTYFAGQGDFPLNDDHITDLLPDADGRLWIANECGISYLRDGRFHNRSDTGFNICSKLCDMGDGRIAGVFNYISIIAYAKDTFEETGRFQVANGEHIADLAGTADKRLIAAINGRDGSRIVILGGDLTPLAEFRRKGTRLTDIHEAFGRVWAGTTEGLLAFPVFRGDDGALAKGATSELLPGGRICFIRRYDETSLIVGQKGKALQVYDSKTGAFSELNRWHKLSKDIYMCAVDSRQNVWLSDHESGYELLPRNEAIRNIALPASYMSDKVIREIVFDRENHLWLRGANDIVGYDIYSDQVTTHLGGHSFNGLFGSPTGLVGVIRDYNCLDVYRARDGVLTLERRLSFDRSVYHGSFLDNGDIRLTTPDSVATVKPSGEIQMSARPKHSTTIGTNPATGLFYYSVGGGVITMETPDGQGIELRTDIENPCTALAFGDGSMLIGSYSDGLNVFDPHSGVTSHIGSYVTDSETGVMSVLSDNSGNIWFSTTSAIYRMERGFGDIVKISDPAFKDGELYNIRSAARAPDGTLAFGGFGGVTLVNTGALSRKRTEPELRFDAVKVNDSLTFDVPDRIRVQPDDRVTIWFGCMRYETISTLNYEYRLEGLDKGWNRMPDLSSVSYNYLPTGRHLFRVRVKDASGNAAKEEISLLIDVRRPLWRSWEAAVLYALLLCALAVPLSRGLRRLNASRKEAGDATAANADEATAGQADDHGPSADTTDATEPFLGADLKDELSGLSTEDRQFMLRVREAIDSHMADEDFSVGSLSDDLGVSYSSLYAKVKAAVGVTPQAYLNSRRMSKARELLLSGKYTVSEVAWQVGSSSPSNFARDFRKAFGISPTDLK